MPVHCVTVTVRQKDELIVNIQRGFIHSLWSSKYSRGKTDRVLVFDYIMWVKPPAHCNFSIGHT